MKMPEDYVEELENALGRWLFLALNGVICDPLNNPCKDCLELFDRTRRLLDDN